MLKRLREKYKIKMDNDLVFYLFGVDSCWNHFKESATIKAQKQRSLNTIIIFEK